MVVNEEMARMEDHGQSIIITLAVVAKVQAQALVVQMVILQQRLVTVMVA